METADVVIVGGGPAGAACARRLREAGLAVIVIDRDAFPREKACAGWLTPLLCEELDIRLADYARTRVLQPITGVRVSVAGASSVDVNYPHAVSFAVRRAEFDTFLLQRSGAQLRLGREIRTITREGDGTWTINGTISTPMLVGAAGTDCPVAKHVFGRSNDASIFSRQCEFAMDADAEVRCKILGHLPELYFSEKLDAVSWAMRKGSYLSIGVAARSAEGLPERTRAFSRLLLEERRIATEPGGFIDRALLTYNASTRPLVGDHALLLGDAAGLAGAAGEGIRRAVESGMIAAESILAAHRAGDFRSRFLASYASGIEHRFGHRPPRRGLLERLLPNALRTRMLRNALARPRFLRRVLVERWLLGEGVHGRALQAAKRSAPAAKKPPQAA